MFYVNRMMRHFTALQEIPTAAVRPRNDIYGGTVQDSVININLVHINAAGVPAAVSIQGESFFCKAGISRSKDSVWAMAWLSLSKRVYRVAEFRKYDGSSK